MKTGTLIRKFDRVLEIFRFRALNLQEIALVLFDIELDQLSSSHLRQTYKFLYPLLAKDLVARIKDSSILRKVGSKRPVYALTEQGSRLARLVNPVFLVREIPFLHEQLFLIHYAEAKKEIEDILQETSDWVIRKILPYRYRIGNNLLLLKSDKIENWWKKYPLFPYLKKEEILNLFPEKGCSVAEFIQKIFKEDKTITSSEIVLSHIDGSIFLLKEKNCTRKL